MASTIARGMPLHSSTDRGLLLALLGSVVLHLLGLAGLQVWAARACRDGKVVCPAQCAQPKRYVRLELTEASRKLAPPPVPKRSRPKPVASVAAPIKPQAQPAAPKRGRIVLPDEALQEADHRPAEATAELPTLPPELVIAQSQAEAPVIATPEVFDRADSLVAGPLSEHGLGGTGTATGAGPFGNDPEGSGTAAATDRVPETPKPAAAPPQPKPAGPTRPPELIASTEPAYPSSARLEGVEGTVVLRVRVLTTGSPAEVTVVQSAGHSALDNAAAREVRHWRFAPALRNGRPIVQHVNVKVAFRLVPS
jgi:protein TonB